MKHYRFKAKGLTEGRNKFTVAGVVSLGEWETNPTDAVVAVVGRQMPGAQFHQITLREVAVRGPRGAR
jgi:hypothetical protein